MSQDLGILVLLLTERGNLACSYCYAQAWAAGGDMSYEQARKSVVSFLRSG